jgi:MSHA biogenesis protein MshL
VFSVAVKTADFAAFLELLKTQGNVHVLSSPRVSTVNNQKAVIKVGGDEFFVTSVTGGTAAVVGVSAATSPTVSSPVFLRLPDVTPQIDDGNIICIHPAVSEVVQKARCSGVRRGLQPAVRLLHPGTDNVSPSTVRSSSSAV